MYKRIFLFFLLLFFPGIVLATTEAFDPSVTSISVSPSEPALNEPVTITVKCKNLGEEKINGYSPSDFSKYFQNFNQESQVIPLITEVEANGSWQYEFTGFFTNIYDRTKLNFTINSSGAVDDWDSGNNSLVKYIKVVEQNDIAIEDISVSPSKPAVGQDVLITVKAQNEGFASLRDSRGWGSYNYIFPDFLLDEEVKPEIDNDKRVLTDEYFYYYYYGHFNSAGEKELEFRVDLSDQLDEKDEANNILNKNITVNASSQDNLKVSSITFSKSDALKNESGEITVSIENDGESSLISDKGLLYANDLDRNPPVFKEIDYDFADFEITEIVYPDYPSFSDPLDPGATVKFVFSGSFPTGGEKLLSFEVNKNKRLSETDYSDNLGSTSKRIYEDEEERDDFEIGALSYEMRSQSSIDIIWTLSKKLSATLLYKRNDQSKWKEKTVNSAAKHRVTVNDLDPGKNHYFKVSASNGIVEKTSDRIIATMPDDNELAFNSGPNLSYTTGQSQASVNFSSNLLSKGALKYRKKGSESYKEVAFSSLAISHSGELSGLENGEYEYFLELTSAPGTSLTSQTYNFSVSIISEDNEQENEDSASETEEQNENLENESPAVDPVDVGNSAIISNFSLYESLKGKIVLTVEQNGEAYYIHPQNQMRYFLGRPDDAFQVMREQGIGISTANLEQIPIGLSETSGPDSDADGLSDLLEDAIGTGKNNKDSDGDGFEDRVEVSQGFDPLGDGNQNTNSSFANSHKGKIFLQVEGSGEAWYVSPENGRRYFLGRPADAFAVMRNLGLGISDENFAKL